MLVTLEHTATGVALILVDAKAENQITVAPGANAGLTAAHVRAALGRLAPHRGDVVIVTHEIPTDAAREALRLGREGGAWTILNPAPAGGLDRSVLGLADVLTPNRGELARLVADDARRSGRATLGAEETDQGREDAARDHQRGAGRRRGDARLPRAPAARCSSGATGRRSTSRRRGSRRSTRPVPATRSTARWRPRWPAG